ncbi:hypothetical protein BPO_1394 [Bergeyella porcorum]|uniref:Uncharacterized protein n=1 Tax=Bergeyella porcorum TaxID=1735111 RepID=A0AAU0F3V7_9FLAO
MTDALTKAVEKERQEVSLRPILKWQGRQVQPVLNIGNQGL